MAASIDLPTEPGCVSHSSAVISDRTDGLRGGVVLVDDRPPPVDHLLLDLHWARRGGVRRRRASGSTGRTNPAMDCGSLSIRVNITGTRLTVSDLVARNGLQTALGVELLHDDDRDARRLHRHRPHRRRGVIQRCGTGIHPLGSIQNPTSADIMPGASDGCTCGSSRLMPLGRPVVPTSTAAGRPRSRRRWAYPVGRQHIPDSAASRRDHRQQSSAPPEAHAAARVPDPPASLAQRRGPDDRFGGAVVDDVGRLGRGEMVLMGT